MLKKLNFWLIAVNIVFIAAVIVFSFLFQKADSHWPVYVCSAVGLIPATILLYRYCISGADVLLAALPLGLFLSFLSNILTEAFLLPEWLRYVALFAVVSVFGIVMAILRRRYRERIIREMINLKE